MSTEPKLTPGEEHDLEVEREREHLKKLLIDGLNSPLAGELTQERLQELRREAQERAATIKQDRRKAGE